MVDSETDEKDSNTTTGIVTDLLAIALAVAFLWYFTSSPAAFAAGTAFVVVWFLLLRYRHRVLGR